MATTRIIPMHLNKGKTLAQCLADILGGSATAAQMAVLVETLQEVLP